MSQRETRSDLDADAVHVPLPGAVQEDLSLMYSLAQLSRRGASPRVFRTPLLLLVLLLLPAVLSAQTVPVNAGGNVSVGGVPALYNGQYVMQKTDFGFLWVDTVALLGGHVQVESKCFLGQPPSVTGLYVLGDCNGISDIKSTGGVVLARQLSGQCGAASMGCGGPRDDGHAYFLFGLGGGFPYLGYGTGNEAGDSTQTADLQGRTWSVTTIDGVRGLFEWRTLGNPTAPPVANVSATNTSAAGRIDKTNYFGDFWTLRDSSTSIATITGIQWDFNYVAPNFTVDRSGSAGETVGAYFPCDPNSGGNVATGANCFSSVGGAAGSYAFSLKATNQYGTTQYTPSPAISVAVPQIQILGFSGGVLAILTGGNADASATQGSPTAFSWTFNPGAIVKTGAVVAVPTGATSFSLAVSYAGYSANVNGSVSQVDLVPGFSVSPNPVIVSTPLTLTNQMQKGPAATLNSVDYAIDAGSFSSLVTCPASFCNVGGTAAITSPPAPAGNHTVRVRYNFTGSSGAQSLTASDPFATIVFTPNPVQIIALDSGGALLACAGFGTCNLQTATTYYLFDLETLPGGVTHPGTQWTYNASPIGTSPGAGPVAWTPGVPCSSGCTLQVTVAGVSRQMPITISGATTVLSFYTVTPCRLLDTRDPVGPWGGPALIAGADRTFTVAGQCGIPGTARAIAANVTVTQATAGPGFLTVYPSGVSIPLASTINYNAGQTRGNNAIVPLGATGDVLVHCGQGSGTAHVVIDVNGYFQ